MRLFIGIKLDDKAKKKIDNYFKLFYENKVRGNYTKISNFHMTLIFLGEINSDKVDKLKDIVGKIKVSNGVLKINKIKMLKGIMIGEIEKTKELDEIYLSLKNELKKESFSFDEHNFYPHITLVRKAENHQKYIGVDMNITSCFDKITLFESKRIGSELVYIDLGG